MSVLLWVFACVAGAGPIMLFVSSSQLVDEAARRSGWSTIQPEVAWN